MNRITSLLLCVSIVLLCDSCYKKIHKGPARWDEVSSVEQAIERGVYAGKFHTEPFEYEDSVFYLKLVFSDVYAVYWHWLDENDSTWKHTDHTYLVAEIDTLQSIGIDKKNACNNQHWSNVDKYFKVSVSCLSVDTVDNMMVFQPNDYFTDSLCLPVKATLIYNRVISLSEQKIISLGQLLFIRESK